MFNKHTLMVAAAAFTFLITSSLVLQTTGFAMPKTKKAAEQNSTSSGTVIESLDSNGYTYMQVDTGKDKIWVAIPAAQVKKGDKVTYYQGMIMPEFKSKSLNRSFEKIVFSSGIVGQGSSTPHQGIPPTPKTVKDGKDSFADAVKAEGGGADASKQMPQASGGSAGAAAPFAEIKVEKASGENAYTVEEIFNKAKELNGKKVRVKGKVVKYNPGIMGKNWLHIQDGTGDPTKRNHDLVVTTNDKLAEKKIITIEGTLVTDKDFGAGYKYAVIVETATIEE